MLFFLLFHHVGRDLREFLRYHIEQDVDEIALNDELVVVAFGTTTRETLGKELLGRFQVDIVRAQAAYDGHVLVSFALILADYYLARLLLLFRFGHSFSASLLMCGLFLALLIVTAASSCTVRN